MINIGVFSKNTEGLKTIVVNVNMTIFITKKPKNMNGKHFVMKIKKNNVIVKTVTLDLLFIQNGVMFIKMKEIKSKK